MAAVDYNIQTDYSPGSDPVSETSNVNLSLHKKLALAKQLGMSLGANANIAQVNQNGWDASIQPSASLNYGPFSLNGSRTFDRYSDDYGHTTNAQNNLGLAYATKLFGGNLNAAVQQSPQSKEISVNYNRKF